MAEKTVILILLRADRELWDGKSAGLQVTDVNKLKLDLLLDKALNPGYLGGIA